MSHNEEIEKGAKGILKNEIKRLKKERDRIQKEISSIDTKICALYTEMMKQILANHKVKKNESQDS